VAWIEDEGERERERAKKRNNTKFGIRIHRTIIKETIAKERNERQESTIEEVNGTDRRQETGER
jgi:hypothetical protein